MTSIRRQGPKPKPWVAAVTRRHDRFLFQSKHELFVERTAERLLAAGLVLLFIAGCWTVGGMTIVPKRLEPGWVRTGLFAADAGASISFLFSILASVLGLAGIVPEEKAGRLAGWLLASGIVCLAASIATFSAYLASGLPWGPYD